MGFDILFDVPLLKESVSQLSLAVKPQYVIGIADTWFWWWVQPCILRYDKIVFFRHDSDNVLKLRTIFQVKIDQDMTPFLPLFILYLGSPNIRGGGQRSFHLPQFMQIIQKSF